MNAAAVEAAGTGGSPMSHILNTNEQGHVWINKVNGYVCTSYLNKMKTDFSDRESEYMYKLHHEHYGRRQASSPKLREPRTTSLKPQA